MSNIIVRVVTKHSNHGRGAAPRGNITKQWWTRWRTRQNNSVFL